jgi:ABC-type multidrug transport system fused ATPase/permease subunit
LQVEAQSSVISKKGHAKFSGPAANRQNRQPSDGGVALISDRTDLDAMEASTSSDSLDPGLSSSKHAIATDGSTYHLVRGFTKARGRIFSLDFKFDRLGLILPNGNAILQSVSARVKPGAVTAIMGPSGAGKTTLLNTLMGKVDPSFKQTGELRINGKIKNMKEFRSVIGFVPQEDIMVRELTVRDNIEFSGRVRLPPSWDASEISK